MDTGLGSLIFESVKKLITSAVSSALIGQLSDFFKRRRIELAVERAVLTVVEPLAAFLEMERITPEQRAMLVYAAELELRPFVLDPGKLFSGSLDGDAMYRQMRLQNPLPEEIKHEQLEAIYELLVPRMGTVLCKLLPVLDEWKTEAWRESFRRFDEMAETLRKVLGRLDAASEASFRENDALLGRIRRGAAQRETFRMDLTALRSDAVIGCGFDALFVQPSFTETNSPGPKHITKSSETLTSFLDRGARAVVVGSAGAGKSTWLRWLERTGNESGWSGIVVRVELRGLLRESKIPSYITLLKSAAGTHLADEITGEVARNWRVAGRLAFLVDGFDEVPADQRDSILAWLLELSNAVGDCPVVLTSRPLTTPHISQLEEEWFSWQIDPFDETQIVEYITRWYRSAELPEGVEREVDATSLASTWSSDPTISPLTGNPLLLATLLLVHVLDGSLPAGRAKLYLRYVEGMLGLWDDRQRRLSPKVVLTPSQKREILRELALRMFMAQVDQIEEGEATSMVEAILPGLGVSAGASGVLDVLRERTGLLIGPGVYSFSHKTVAEFLVAEAIVDGTIRDEGGERIDRMRLFRNRYDDRWTVVTFLWAGLAPAVEFERFILDLIESSNSLDNWSLALGLLNDQFDRLSRELWERCLAVFAEFPLVPFRNHTYSAMGINVSVAAPAIELRTISEQGGLLGLFRKARARDYMSCLLKEKFNRGTNAAIKWFLATEPSYGELWRLALQPPEGWREDDGWAMVAGAWSVFFLLRAEEREQREFVSQLSLFWSACADEIGLQILWLMSKGLLLNEDLKAAVKYLAKVDPARISDARFRKLPGIEPPDQRALGGALSAIQDAVAHGTISDDELTQRAIVCAKVLIERAARLGPISPASTRGGKENTK